MFTKITAAPKKVVAHVKEKRGRYAVTAGFITGAVAMRTVGNFAYDDAMRFIEANDLKDKFFNKIEN